MKASGVKIGIVLLIIGCVVLVSGVVLTRSSEEEPTENQPVEKVAKAAPVKTKQVELESVESTELSDIAEPGLSEQQVAEIKAEVAEEQRQRLMRSVEKKMSNPGMNQIMAQQQRILMNEQFRGLAKTLGLNEEEAEYFIDLLLQRQMLRVDFGMKMMTGMLTPEEQAQMIQQLEADTAPIMEEVDYFLNHAEDSEYFKYYERTEQHRSAINNMKAQSGGSIDNDTGEELVNIIFDTVNNSNFSVQLENNGEPDFSQFTDENINILINEMNALAPTAIQRASGFMNPDELYLFEQAYMNYVMAEKNRLLMMKGFFNQN